jgi:hypothetical protein
MVYFLTELIGVHSTAHQTTHFGLWTGLIKMALALISKHYRAFDRTYIKFFQQHVIIIISLLLPTAGAQAFLMDYT